MTPKYRTIAAGLIRFDGPDAASFLHALVTNSVDALEPGQGVYAAWLTPQGRMITDLRLLRDSGQVWAEVPADLAQSLATRFDLLIFSEQVQVTDQSDAMSVIAVWGAKAAGAVASATGITADAVSALPLLAHLTAAALRVVRTDNVATENFEIWVPTSREPDVIAALRTAGAEEGDADLLEALRVEGGRPQFGVDMTPDTIPLEAGLLDRAISTTKGCYVGQEVIVRILHRGGGRVVKHLALLGSAEGATQVPAPGAVVLDEGREVGAVTSAALGPTTGRMWALALVHRDSAEPGRTLTVGGEPWTLDRLTN